MADTGGTTGRFSGDEWRGRVGGSWAEEWARTDRSFGGLTDRLIAAFVGALPEFSDSRQQAVLDIGCGAGETTLRLAAHRRDLAVTGLDLSPDLIAAAQARASGVAKVDFVTGDATAWRGATGYAGAVSRHGVMFFDDPKPAFAHIRTLIAPGAPLVFTCFAARAKNLWSDLARDLLPPTPRIDPHAPGPFAFAEQDYVHDILTASGWRDAVCEPLDYHYVAGAGEAPVNDALAFFKRIGPVARQLAGLDQETRAAFLPTFRAMLADHEVDGEVRFAACAWLWRAVA